MDLIFFAAIALYLVYKLLNTIGKEEEMPPTSFNVSEVGDMTASSVIDIPIVREIVVSEETESAKPEIAAVYHRINKSDPKFTEKYFITAAKAAYEMIIKAFSEGDKELLAGLVNLKLQQAFASEIDRRKTLTEYNCYHLVAVKATQVRDAKIVASRVEITVEFDSEQMQTHYQNDEVASHSSILKQDVWTFAKDLKSANPAWLLVATS